MPRARQNAASFSRSIEMGSSATLIEYIIPHLVLGGKEKVRTKNYKNSK